LADDFNLKIRSTIEGINKVIDQIERLELAINKLKQLSGAINLGQVTGAGKAGAEVQKQADQAIQETKKTSQKAGQEAGTAYVAGFESAIRGKLQRAIEEQRLTPGAMKV